MDKNIYHSGNLNSGTTPPTHVGGTVNDLRFTRKSYKSWTIVTAELVSGVLDEEIVKVEYNALDQQLTITIYRWALPRSDYNAINTINCRQPGNPFSISWKPRSDYITFY